MKTTSRPAIPRSWRGYKNIVLFVLLAAVGVGCIPKKGIGVSAGSGLATSVSRFYPPPALGTPISSLFKSDSLLVWTYTDGSEVGAGDGYGWLSTRRGQPWLFCWGEGHRDTLDGIIVLSDSILVEGKYRVGMSLAEIQALGMLGEIMVNDENPYEEFLGLKGEKIWDAVFSSLPKDRIARYDSTLSYAPVFSGIRLPEARILRLECWNGWPPEKK